MGRAQSVVDRLPSSQTSPASGGLTSGVSDIQFINGTLYGMEAGAGCSHGLAGTNNTIFRVHSDGTTTVANLSAFVKAHPVAHPDVGDFEPDGTWYSMIEVQGVFYATEPNHQEVDRITPDGKITRVVDLSTMFVPPNGWQGATSIVYHGGSFYFGTLGTFPVRPDTQSIYKITPSGSVKVAASGLTAVLGIAFDARGRLYALETDTVAGFPSHGCKFRSGSACQFRWHTDHNCFGPELPHGHDLQSSRRRTLRLEQRLWRPRARRGTGCADQHWLNDCN